MTKLLLPYGNGNLEYTSNTLNLRRLRRRRKFDVEYTLILRWRVVIRWTGLFNVESTSTFILRLVRWIFLRRWIGFYVEKYLSESVYFSTSNPHRFNVDVYPAIRWIFYVSSTSILRRKESVRTVYIFQRQIHVDSTSKFPYIHQACWFINVEYTWILLRGFLTVAKGTSLGTLRSPLCPFLPSLAL